MEAQGLDYAFSAEGLIAQLPFALLVFAIFRHQLHRLRAFVAVAAAVGLAQAMLWQGSFVAALWWGILLAAALLLLVHRLYENSLVRFTPEEEAMVKGLLRDLPRARARHLLDQGFWLTGAEGDVLTREEEPISHFYYLAAGEARVISRGRQVGLCRAGDLIGEVTIQSGDQASATVVLDTPARFWCASAEVLRPYLEAHEDVRRALEQGFTTALRAKLRQSNERLARAGGAAF